MNTFEEGEIKEAIPNDADGKVHWSGTFTWKCNEKFVQKIAKAKHSQAFESKIFEIGQIKWFLRLYPNGSGKNNMGFVNLFLYLRAVPHNLSKLRVKYSIFCGETDTNWNHIKDYKANAMGSGWSNHRLSRDKLFKFSTFSFKINVAILQKYDKQNNVIPFIPLVPLAKMKQKGKKSIKINQNNPIIPIAIPNININHDHINHNNDIQEIKRSIHSLKSQMQEIQITVDNIMTNIDNIEENKNNNDTNQLIFQMLKEIKNDIYQLKNEENQEKKEKISIQNWLQNIGFSEYYPLFVNKGYDNIKLIQDIKKDEFDAIQFYQENDGLSLWIAIQSLKSLQL